MATSVPTTSVPKGTKSLGRARSIVWTLNNYTDVSVDVLRHLAKDCRYIVWGYEIAPSTGTPHLQGYTAWDNPRSLDKFALFFEKKIHIERPRGTAKQCADYCKKPDTKDPTKPAPGWEEFGELPRQGERTDWCVAVEELKSGIPVEDVVENQPQLLPCIRALDSFKARMLKPLRRDVEVIVLWGEAGSGKSSYAYDNHPDLYSKPPSKWWDGYSGQDVILFDDFYGYIPYSELLNVLDRYPYHAEVKGGYVWAQWKKVIITSNKHPKEWYSYGLTPALARRINKILYCTKNNPPLNQLVIAEEKSAPIV